MDQMDLNLSDQELGKVNGAGDYESSWRTVFTNMKNDGYSYEFIREKAVNANGRSAEDVAMMTRVLNEVFEK